MFLECSLECYIGSAFQRLPEFTATVHANSDFLVSGLINIQGWPLLFPDVCGANNRLVFRLVNPLILLKIAIRSPHTRQRSRENSSQITNLTSYTRWHRPGTSLTSAYCSPSFFRISSRTDDDHA